MNLFANTIVGGVSGASITDDVATNVNQYLGMSRITSGA